MWRARAVVLVVLQLGVLSAQELAPDASAASHAAARAIGEATTAEEVRRLAAVARGAETELGRALVGLIAGEDVELVRVGAELLLELPPAVCREALSDVTPGFRFALGRMVERVGEERELALQLYARVLTPRELQERILVWVDEGDESLALRLLELAGAAATPPGEVFRELASMDLRGRLAESQAVGLAELVRRDEGAAAEALQRVKLRLSLSPSLVVSLGALPPGRWSEAREIVGALLTDLADESEAHAEPELLAAAVATAAQLLVEELLGLLPALLDHEQTRVRLAAIRAVAQVGYRDAPTIDRLIAMLDVPQLAPTAHTALRTKAGVDLPLRAEVWRAWRRSVQLPSEPPDTPEQRLARMRDARERLWRVARASRSGAVASAGATWWSSGVESPFSAPAPPPGSGQVDAPVAPDGQPSVERVEGIPLSAGTLAGLIVLSFLLGWVWQARAAERRAVRWVVAASSSGERAAALERAVQALPAESAQEVARLERLLEAPRASPQAGLERGDRAVVGELRAALSAIEQSRAKAGPTPREALGELLRLGWALEDDQGEQGFDTIQRRVQDLEQMVEGAGFTEIGREFCFLLVQLAYAARHGKPLSQVAAARWQELLRLAPKLAAESGLGPIDPVVREASEAGSTIRPDTLDVDDLFDRPLGPAGLAVAGTLDVSAVFPDELAAPQAPQVGPRSTPLAPTQDVADVFSGEVNDSALAGREPTQDVADVFPELALTAAAEVPSSSPGREQTMDVEDVFPLPPDVWREALEAGGTVGRG